MAKYFFKVDISYSQKNKLFQEFHDFVRTQDYTLITSDTGKRKFKESLLKMSKQLNEKHKRCNPIYLEMGNYYSSSSIEDIRVSGSFTAKIYNVKIETDGKDL